MNRKSWQRITLSLIGLTLVQIIWYQAVNHLYTLPVASLAAFTTITTNTLYAGCVIVIFLVTGKSIADWKNSTTATVIEQGQQIFEEKIDRTPAPKHFDNEDIS